jgi:hypothetical protein
MAVISKNTTLIREYTCGITKQLEKQDEILKQIAWLRAVILHKSVVNQDRAFLMEKYPDSLTDYASSVWGDSVSEDVAREMNLCSLGNSSTSTSFWCLIVPAASKHHSCFSFGANICFLSLSPPRLVHHPHHVLPTDK